MSRVKSHPMRGGNAFKLGVFGANADGCLSITNHADRWMADWDDVVAAAQMADRAGLDFFLPLARWKGFGGDTNARHISYETFTFAAALAGLTEQIALFSTVHTLIVPPVYAAKALATVDHASHGRAGLNIVCGWNQPEFDMFGLTKPDQVYDQGKEWFEILTRTLEGGAPFDYKGDYFDLKGVSGAPGSVQDPHPVTLSAAFSPPGRDFAASACDCIFTTFNTHEDARETIADFRARVEKAGSNAGVFAPVHVVCRPTTQEAEDYYTAYAVTETDNAAVDQHMAMKKSMSGSHDPKAYDLYRKRFAGGAGTYPLIGTPEQIADEMIALHDLGFGGLALSFVNPKYELPYFLDRVLPLLKKAGIRT
ncbi:LLM class flavin-dependent oxidoreductase [Paremcibacter congregatus]|uniref:LLM class flavin-dependent oxidoreductase n=1 Tax=Paremcibacter congregatus TaxID=2043170 RepID=UPI0030EBA483